MKLYNYKECGLGVWHNWFAWYPVRTNTNEVIWLETVQRKIREDLLGIYYYSYNRINKEEDNE